MYSFPKPKQLDSFFKVSKLEDVYNAINQLIISDYMVLPTVLHEHYPMLFAPPLVQTASAETTSTTAANPTVYTATVGPYYTSSIGQAAYTATPEPENITSASTTNTTVYKVTLISTPAKINAVKAIRDVTGLNVHQAKALVDKCPMPVLITPDLDEATNLRNMLKDYADADVYITTY